MLRLARIVKNYEEAGALNGQINLYGFLSDQVFLTKSGELGVILEVRGVDYECLDGASIDALSKRLEAAIRNRIRYLESKSDKLFSLSLYYLVLFSGSRTARTITSLLAEIPERPLEAFSELRAWFSTQKQIVLQDRELSRAESILLQKTRSFLLQVQDFVSVRMLDKQDAFRVLTQILNFAPQKIAHARLKHDTFLDYYLCGSHLECHRGHLRVDDYYLKVFTLKEPSAQSFPLMLKRLLEVEANFYVVTEWKREDAGKTRRVIQAKRRHFHNTKRSFFSQVNLQDAAPQDVLLDDARESQVRELGEGIKELELHGNYFGQFSLTVVVYDLDLAAVDRASAEFYKVFSVHDAQLYEERYNLLNAFLAAVPGNDAFNLRYLYLLNTNYADYSFLFTLDSGHPRNDHLRQEYLAGLETNHGTPYFFNLHYRDVAHSMILGRTGSGKSFLLNFLITNLQKYAPYTFIFDLGGSFESLSKLFHGSYVSVGVESCGFSINPFALAPTKENLDFLTLFLKLLAGDAKFGPASEREIYQQIENLYTVDAELRTLGVLANTLPHTLSEHLAKWTRGGQFGCLFDNPVDTISFSTFQCFDFQKMSQYPEILEPLLFYILHRANEVIRDQAI